MIVDIFIPCYVDQFNPGVAHSMIKVLERLGCGVNYNVDQTCCGRPAFEDGYRDHCKEVGEKLIREFQEDRYIVCPGSACVSTVKNQYPSLFHNSSMHNEYKLVQKHMYEFSDFLVSIMNVSDLGAKLQGKAVCLNACSALRELGIKDAPQQLLLNVRGLTLLDAERIWPCCGAGGGQERKNEKLAVDMAMELLREVKQSGADLIIVNESSCAMHLEGVIAKTGNAIRVMHIAEVLASGWE